MLAAIATTMLLALDGPARDWLLRPWSGADDHHLAGWAAWHGRLMVAAWGVLIPLGTLAARYLKVWPRQDWPRELDHQGWWRLHRGFQILGILVATAALALVWPHARRATPLAAAHAWIGGAVMLIGWSQIAGGYLRGSKGGPTDLRAAANRSDHYLMTRRRRLFEHVHKRLGYGALLLSLVAVPIGLELADAPRWMWIVIAGWWLLLLGIAVKLQRDGRCIDTYHAIWGPDPTLPGNRMRPIGWRVSRPTSQPGR